MGFTLVALSSPWVLWPGSPRGAPCVVVALESQPWGFRGQREGGSLSSSSRVTVVCEG